MPPRPSDLVAPKPPAWLSKGARVEWRRLAPVAFNLGSLKFADMRAFGLLCETLAQAEDARRTIARDGMTIAAGSGGRKAHPALRVLATAQAQAAKLMAEFGLTPAARSRARFDPPEDGWWTLADCDARLVEDE